MKYSRHIRPFPIRVPFLVLLFYTTLLMDVAPAQTIGRRVGPQLQFVTSSARSIALGDASMALIDDFAGPGGNPSVLGFFKTSTVDYSAQQLLDGVSFQHFGFVYAPTKIEAIAVNVDILHFGGLDFYTDSNVRGRGFEARGGISYGRLVTDGLSLGITLQALNATTDVNPLWAVVADIGLTYAPGRYVRYGLAFRGIGSDYDILSPVLPVDSPDHRFSKLIAMGLVLDYPFVGKGRRLILAMQNDKVLGEEFILYRVGVEYQQIFFAPLRTSLRTGFVIRGTEFEPRAGFAFGYSVVSVDYAYRYSRRDGQASHVVGLTLEWR